MKVYCHDFGQPHKELFEGIPFDKFGYYAARILPSAQPGDFVILPLDQRSADAAKTLPYLNELGLGCNPEDIVHLGVSDEYEIIDPDGALKQMKKLKKHQPEPVIVPFTGMAPLPHILSRELSLFVNSPDQDQVRWQDGKDYFQNTGIPVIADGVTLQHPGDAVKYFKSLNGCLHIAKSAHAASGLSATLVHPNGKGRDKVMEFLESGLVVVMQKYYRHNMSPSVNLEISPEGRFSRLFVTNQIFSLSDNGVEVSEGNIYPSGLPVEVEKYLIAGTLQIARKYHADGYYGSMGTDWIIYLDDASARTADYHDRAVEVNARETAPKFAYAIMQRLGVTAFSLKNLHFPVGLTMDDLRQKTDSVAWNPGTRSGLVMFNLNFLDGKLMAVCLSDHREATIDLMKETEKLLIN